MVYGPISSANVTINANSVEGQNFSLALLLAPHNAFQDDLVYITSATDLDSQGLNSPLYQFAAAYFLTTPKPAGLKIGRVDATFNFVCAANVVNGLTLTVFDSGTPYAASFQTAGGVATAEANATSLAALLNANANVTAQVTVTALGDTITIVPVVSGDKFLVEDPLGGSIEYTSVASYATALGDHIEEDGQFYFVGAVDHSAVIQEELAQYVESLAGARMYFTSSQRVTDLSGSNTFKQFAETGYHRTKGVFQHDADTSFPEAALMGYNAPYLPGSVSWTNLVVAMAPSRNPSTGRYLTSTEKNFLESCKVAYLDRVGGNGVFRNGRAFSGVPIDVTHGRDNMVDDLEVALTTVHLNQQGTKLPYNNEGIAVLENVTRDVLNQYVDRNFINSNFTMNFPPYNKVPVADREARVYRSGSFKAEITGAIESSQVNGNLVISLG